jgi:hypothetical protein
VTTSGSYRDVRDLVAQLQLPSDTIGQVIRLQCTSTDRADAVRGDATLTTAQRDAQLAALVQEAKAKLGEVFGAEGFARYQRTSAGAWLQQLAPRNPAPSRP